MSRKLKMAFGLISSLVVMLFALYFEASGVGAIQISRLPKLPEQNGFTGATLLLVDGLLLLAIVFYVGALIIPQVRLALIQAISVTVYGLVMVFGGGLLIMLGLAKFGGLIAMLLAFPFGTIAYFAKFNCDGSVVLEWFSTLANLAGNRCFNGTMAVILFALLLKLLSLLILFITSWKFLKVKALIILGALSLCLSAGLVLAMGMLSSLHFLLYPADALLAALMGLVAVVYGIVTFVKGVMALVMSIAAQAG